MSARRSLQVWTVYVLGMGALLLLVPNTLFGILGIASTQEPWVRLVGVVVIALGVIYATVVTYDDRVGYQASVYARWAAFVGMVALGLSTGPWQLVLFGTIDLASSLWTMAALRAGETRPAPA